jgi:predicted DNA-binding transcriptional regulator YafY
LQKLSGVMASAPRSTASKLVSHIRVAQPPPTDLGQSIISVLQQSLIDSVAVSMQYRDFKGQETTRVVEPAGLLGTHRGWYLAGYCRLRQAPRAFRLDRIASAALLDEPVTPRSLDSVLPDIPFELTEPALM